MKENLNENYILTGSNISQLPSIFGVSDSWFSRNPLFRQSPYNAMTVKYDNVVLNSVTDGSFRGDMFLSANQLSNMYLFPNDISFNSDNLSGNIEINSKKTDSSQVAVILQGGNLFGNFLLDYKSKHKYLNWNASADYLTSPGFDVSESKPDTVESTRTNSNFEKLNINTGIGVSDKKSNLFASFLYSQSKQNFPYSLVADKQIYLKEPEYKLNILNLQFSSEFNNNLLMKGNIFYIRSKSIIEKYDTPLFDTHNLNSSFIKSFEENKFGWNSRLLFTANNLPQGEASFNYSRESVKYQSNPGLPINHYDLEKLSLGIRFYGQGEMWGYILSAVYKTVNPLTSPSSGFISGFSDMEYCISVNYNISKPLRLIFSNSRKIMLPQLYQIYSEINQIPMRFSNLESTVNNAFEFGLNGIISDNLKFSIIYFNSTFENIAPPFALTEYPIEITKSNFNSDGIEINGKADIYFAELHLNGLFNFNHVSVYDIFGREMITPEININAEINKLYEFGFMWRIFLTSVAGRYSANPAETPLSNFNLLNLKISQQIYSKNEIFVSIYNLTDTYYEIYRNIPLNGIYFVAGVKFLL